MLNKILVAYDGSSQSSPNSWALGTPIQLLCCRRNFSASFARRLRRCSAFCVLRIAARASIERESLFLLHVLDLPDPVARIGPLSDERHSYEHHV
jgi:hypothetical protein